MKKSIFCIISISICVSLSLVSCSKKAVNSKDPHENEIAAKAEVAGQPSSESQIQGNAENGDLKAAETKPDDASTKDTAKSKDGIVQSNAAGTVPKYVEVKLDANAEIPEREPRVVGAFGSAQWKDFEEKFEAPLLSIDSGKEIIAEMEKSLDLVCDSQTKQQTMPSGVVFQAVNCASKQHSQDNAENKKGYFYREIGHNEEKFYFVDDCHPESTSVYVVFTSPTDHISRVFRLKDVVDTYSCGSEDFPA